MPRQPRRADAAAGHAAAFATPGCRLLMPRALHTIYRAATLPLSIFTATPFCRMKMREDCRGYERVLRAVLRAARGARARAKKSY